MSSHSPLSGHPYKTVTLLLPVLFIPLPGLAAEEKISTWATLRSVMNRPLLTAPKIKSMTKMSLP